MAEIWAWLLFFFFLIALLSMVVFQLMCLSDLEFDYINPYDSASRINGLVLPEFITQGVLCVLYLITGHWVMCLLCVPYLYYNFIFFDLGPWRWRSGLDMEKKQNCTVKIKGQDKLLHRSSDLHSVEPQCVRPFVDRRNLSSFSLRYSRRQHLVDVTEIFNQLNWEKKQRLFKLGYIILILFISLFWLIYSALEYDEGSL